MKKIRLIEHYGEQGPGFIMTPEIDEVADILVRRGVAEYVDEPKPKPVVKKQAWVK